MKGQKSGSERKVFLPRMSSRLVACNVFSNGLWFALDLTTTRGPANSLNFDSLF